MRASWRSGCLALLLTLGFAPTVRATEVRIERIAATSQGFLYLEFELVDPFEGIYLEALQSGLPTTLSYTFEVWRQRTGWWDKLERTDEREFRLVRNLLTDEYLAVTREETAVFGSFDSLVAGVCRFRRDAPQRPLPLPFPSRDLRMDRQYYVVVTVKLAPLSVEDLNELDDWLRATIRGRGGETGGIAGLSRTMGGLLMSMTGFGDRTVRGRTPHFRPVEILEQPWQAEPERSGLEAGEEREPAPEPDTQAP